MRSRRPAGSTYSRVVVLLIAISTAAPAPLAAQQQSRDTAVVLLDSLSVAVLRRPATVARAPVAVSVVEAERIQLGQATLGLDESLAAVPGVLVNNRYNPSLGTRISIRGFGARAAFGVRGVRILADGIPLTMPDGQSNLNNVDLGSAGRIEVIRGPASMLYGNAAGGVIAIQTEPAPAAPFSTEARVTAGGLDAREGGIDAVRKLQFKVGSRSDRWDVLASVARQEVDGFRDFSASRLTQLNARVVHASEAARWTVVFNAIDQPVAESPGALPIDSVLKDPRLAWPANVRTGSGEEVRQAQLGVSYRYDWAAATLDASVYAATRSLDNALPFAFIRLGRSAGGARAAVHASRMVGSVPLVLSAGFELEAQRDEREEFNNDGGRPGSERTRDQVDRVGAFGPFLQLVARVDPRFELSGGVRFDAVRLETEDAFLGDGRDDSGGRTLTAFSPVVGVLYSASPRANVYANIATSFQTPTTTELINAPPEPGQPCCPGGFNAALEPQRSTSMEAGVRGEVSRHLRYEAAIYHMDVRNALVPFQVPEVDAREFFRNAAKSRHRGLELGLSTFVGRTQGTLAYTYSHFTFVDDGIDEASFEGNRVPGVPPHRWFGQLSLRIGRGVVIQTDIEHASEYFANDANDESAVNRSATVLDGRVIWQGRLASIAVTPFLAMNNVMDEHHNSSVVVNAIGRRYFEPAPGRHLFLGVTVGTGGWAR